MMAKTVGTKNKQRWRRRREGGREDDENNFAVESFQRRLSVGQEAGHGELYIRKDINL